MTPLGRTRWRRSREPRQAVPKGGAQRPTLTAAGARGARERARPHPTSSRTPRRRGLAAALGQRRSELLSAPCGRPLAWKPERERLTDHGSHHRPTIGECSWKTDTPSRSPRTLPRSERAGSPSSCSSRGSPSTRSRWPHSPPGPWRTGRADFRSTGVCRRRNLQPRSGRESRSACRCDRPSRATHVAQTGRRPSLNRWVARDALRASRDLAHLGEEHRRDGWAEPHAVRSEPERDVLGVHGGGIDGEDDRSAVAGSDGVRGCLVGREMDVLAAHRLEPLAKDRRGQIRRRCRGTGWLVVRQVRTPARFRLNGPVPHGSANPSRRTRTAAWGSSPRAS